MRRSRWSRTLVVLVVLVSMVALVGAGPPPSRPTPGEVAFAPGRILVKFRPGVSAAQKAADHRAQGAHVLEVIPGIDVVVISVPKGAERAKVAAYARSPLVAYAEPDYMAHALGQPDDEFFDLQWGLHNPADTDIDAPEAWGIATGDPEIKIAILDTGIDQDHPDLVGKLVAADNVNLTNSRTVDDLYGHGTHVAGIAAAETDNGEGVAGVGYNCSLLNVKVLNDRGSGRYSWIAYGIIWAADNDAQVINMSLGGYSYSDTLEDAVNYAWNKGVVLAAAAGNDDTSDKLYPAAYEYCIAVAATDANDERVNESGWWASNYGDWVDVAAPGLYVYSTIPNHGSRIWGAPDGTPPYGYGSGTSMATPFVSGLAALVWSIDLDSDPGTENTGAAVRDRIEATCDAIGVLGTDWKHGRINACKAVGGTCDGAVSNPPTADDKTVGTDEDTPVNITLSGSDDETCDLSFSIVSGPSNGTLSTITDQACASGTPNRDTVLVAYTPNADYNGSDSFVYRVTDAEVASDDATVSITVNAVNDAPVANDDSVTTLKETAVTIDVLANDTDADGDPLKVTILSPPSNGTATLSADGKVIYTPDEGFVGDDTFTYTAHDGTVDSNVATVTVTVSEAGATMPMHVGDLDGVKDLKGKSGRWEVFVTVTIHDESHSAVANATVTGDWSGAKTGTVSGATLSDGTVTFSTGNMNGGTEVTLTVTGVEHATLTYDDATANHDPDEDSKGTFITIYK